ncbi:Molybdenum ABC transporter, periplasmic binding protein [Nitrospira lenta]|uniref:Molybdenum ABC transporter, periplasmic binding protein n=1 Tax=Nitrospira lenta TaxID=1436998 RepID=A0A330L7W9_9BACT|nr:Molybdenum ABC transporter, periplasmic binding protein [Nitrospira lenta]
MHHDRLSQEIHVASAHGTAKKRHTIMKFGNVGLIMAIAIGLAGAFGTNGFAQTESLTVGAPPSLRAVFTEILPMFEREYGASVNVVYAPSKTLSHQIEQGAPIDVFLAAGTDEVAQLYKKGLTLNGRPRTYAQTSLVLVMSTETLATLVSFHDALPNRTTRIALGDPRTSALGDVTARVLARVNPNYMDKSRSNIIYASHSEDIINLIHAGKADVGLVYRVDAINGGQVRISDETPAESYVPVQFGQAVVSTCQEGARGIAKDFSDFLMTPRVQKLLIKYGFDSLPTVG